MEPRHFRWHDHAGSHDLTLVRVQGTHGSPYQFGHGAEQRAIEVSDFLMATTPVTQAFWQRVMRSNPSVRHDPRCPVENVACEHVTQPGEFLDRLNEMRTTVASAFVSFSPTTGRQQPDLQMEPMRPTGPMPPCRR